MALGSRRTSILATAQRVKYPQNTRKYRTALENRNHPSRPQSIASSGSWVRSWQL